MAREGLLLDWGGVLTTDLFAAFGEFCEAEGLAPHTVRDAFRHDREARDLLIAFEEGKVDEDVFSAGLAKALGLAPERAEGMIDRVFAGFHPEPEMLEAVRRFRAAGIRTGLISNSWGAERYPADLLDELFDGIVISGLEGMRKPAPRMYELGAERIGLLPGQCVFVDDLPFNLEPARELGMAVVHHTRAGTTIDELQELLGVSL
ncbi:MAG: HAD family phosphatase [Solirubrobacterales bacterium]|nr:HAD family phosphatase [Solirubrobacterales bacterium]